MQDELEKALGTGPQAEEQEGSDEDISVDDEDMRMKFDQLDLNGGDNEEMEQE